MPAEGIHLTSLREGLAIAKLSPTMGRAVARAEHAARFGALFVYGRIVELAFDDTEKEYWTTAAHLVGLSLHWHALRRKLLTKVS